MYRMIVCSLMLCLLTSPLMAQPQVEWPAEPDDNGETDMMLKGLAENRREQPRTTLGGYAELHYNHVSTEGEDEAETEIDLHRLVLFVAHPFNEVLRFYTEIEVEHSTVGKTNSGYVAVEQAFVEFDLFKKYLTWRAGVILVPLGIINQWHEPPIFHGVERPKMENVIIPTTWREAGVGFVGEIIEGLHYEAYVMGGLNAQGFTASKGLRDGRQNAAEARMDGVAFTGRVEYEPTLGLAIGGAGYVGWAGPNMEGLFDAAGNPLGLDVPVRGGTFDVRLRRWGVEARLLAAMFSIGDTAALREATKEDGSSAGLDVGSRLLGFYGEVGWNALYFVESEHQLVPFFRYEQYDTLSQIEGRERVAADDKRAVTDLVFGLTYRPIPQVSVKTDVILRQAGGDSPKQTVIDLGVGMMF